MSDRLAVFNRGRIEQVGSPADVYERPATGFVAGFVGVSNVLEGETAAAIAGDPHAVHDPTGEDLDAAGPTRPWMATPAPRPAMCGRSCTSGATTRYVVELASWAARSW